MSNIMAAIGIEQLKRFNYFKQRRKQIASQYIDMLRIMMKSSYFLSIIKI